MEINTLDAHKEHCNADLVLLICQLKVFLQPSDPSVSCQAAIISAECPLHSMLHKIYQYLFDPGGSNIRLLAPELS
jgi:hypothetical protein